MNQTGRVEIVEVLVLGLEDQSVREDRVDDRVDLVVLERQVTVEERPAAPDAAGTSGLR